MNKLVYHSFMENIMSSITIHSNALESIVLHYYMEETLKNNIHTQTELDELKKHKLYIPYEFVQNYFSSLIKNDYNFTELTIISACLYDNMLICQDVINIFYTTIKNYYGKGKIGLDRSNPEEFISLVNSKYDKELIRKQLKTVNQLEILINTFIKVIEEYIVSILPGKFKVVFKLKKDTTLQTLIELTDDHLDFADINIEQLKKKYKEDNINLYKGIMDIINKVCEINNFYMIFEFVFSRNFNILEKNKNIVKCVDNNYKMYNNVKMHTSFKHFITNNFPVDKICIDVMQELLYKNYMYTVSLQYYKNLTLYKYITSK